jgi:unsaturated rhamnogalacturonyl hydrolase
MFYIDEYLNKALEELKTETPDTWGNEKACILMGLYALATAAGNDEYLQKLYQCLAESNHEKWTAIGTCGAFDRTHEDCYKETAVQLMNQLKGELDTTNDEMALVFYMKYETRFGGKEHYQDVVNRLKEAAAAENKDTAYCMTALIEALESVDQAIYEYYDVIKRLFKTCLTQMLEQEEMDSTEMALAGYAILKACRMKAILSEKYEEMGVELVSAALEASESADMDMGACIMAYAEGLLHK